MPHSTLVHSSICDDAPERVMHITRKKKRKCTDRRTYERMGGRADGGRQTDRLIDKGRTGVRAGGLAG